MKGQRRVQSAIPDGPDDQRYDESFASGEGLLVDEAAWFCHRCSLTAGEDGQQDDGAECEFQRLGEEPP